MHISTFFIPFLLHLLYAIFYIWRYHSLALSVYWMQFEMQQDDIY